MNTLIGQQSQRILGVVQGVAEFLRRLPGARVIEATIRAYSEDRASVTAAALAYYMLLSLFPLMLFIVAITSPFLESGFAVREVSRFVSSYLPDTTGVLTKSLEEVTHLQGPLTIVAAIGFLWSASGVFDLLQLGLNRAFAVRQPRPIWRQRLVSLGMVVTISLLFGLSFLLTNGLRLAIHYGVLARHNVVVDYISPLTSFLLGTLMFGLLYRYVPYTCNLRWRNVWLTAGLASALWEIGKWGFAWYLTNLAVLNLVYGSVGAVIAVMIWGYITSVVLLAGAELAAVSSGARERNRMDQAKAT